MLIEKDGTIDNSINTVLLSNDLMVELDNKQWFQITDTGKRLELWQELEDGRMLRLKYWNMSKSVISFFAVN